jgi:enamine deaminase RidA (YjgF/YER057c/UK114 family)
MQDKQLISSGSKWEKIVGYSRAVRVGNIIEVSGTVSANEEGHIVGLGDAYEQTKFIFKKIEKALQAAGGSLDHVIRTRIFVTDISQWEKIGKAHGEIFKAIKPVTTMVEVSKLIQEEFLVEVEVSAVISSAA